MITEKYCNEILQQYPEYITKDQMYRICHISKKTCLFLLESGLVPNIDSGKKTRRFKIKTVDVIQYLKDRDDYPELFKAPDGFYKGKGGDKKAPSFDEVFTQEDLIRMRQYYERLLKNNPDVMSVEQVAQFTGYNKNSVSRWCGKKELKCFYIKQRYQIPIIFLVFGVKGYFMYQEAVKAYPISQMVSSIQNRENFVEYDELPTIYIDAVISAEDKRFETHCGVDLIAISRAVVNDIKAMSFVEGGSTITQQIAKNQYFTQEKKLERKFAEIFTAIELEQYCSKQEIFELYVNTIYFGNGYYGIYDAAKGYYGKLPSELSDYEAIMLAGLPNAPSAYSLNTNPDLAYSRMKIVLSRMVECGVITQEQANDILANGN